MKIIILLYRLIVDILANNTQIQRREYTPYVFRNCETLVGIERGQCYHHKHLSFNGGNIRDTYIRSKENIHRVASLQSIQTLHDRWHQRISAISINFRVLFPTMIMNVYPSLWELDVFSYIEYWGTGRIYDVIRFIVLSCGIEADAMTPSYVLISLHRIVCYRGMWVWNVTQINTIQKIDGWKQ